MKNKKGFTLIELLVVVLIIGILSAVALPQYTRAVEKARVAEVETIMADLRRGYKMYSVEHPGNKMMHGGGIYVLANPSLEEIMKSGGFSYPLAGGKIVTNNFTINEPSFLHASIAGTCAGEFSASRSDGSYLVTFSSGDPVTKCCQGKTDKGKEICKGLGAGWTVSDGPIRFEGDYEREIGGEIIRERLP